MKKLFFFAIVCALFVSCDTGNNKKVLPAIEFDKGILTTSDTELIEIRFEEGESPYFDNYMDTGTENDHIVWFAFYKANDIDNGRVKQGAMPCRYYQVILPNGEKAKSWGYGPIITLRPDGTEHEIAIELVNQPI